MGSILGGSAPKPPPIPVPPPIAAPATAANALVSRAGTTARNRAAAVMSDEGTGARGLQNKPDTARATLLGG